MTQVVELSDDAYRRLTNAKRPEESYSDVVLRLLGGGDLTDLQGLRSPQAIEAAEREIEQANQFALASFLGGTMSRLPRPLSTRMSRS